MSATIYVGGTSKGVGKTFVTLGLLHLLSQNHKTAAWKAVDVGQMEYNAVDEPSDGLRIASSGNMNEHPNLVNPFLLNEDLHRISRTSGWNYAENKYICGIISNSFVFDLSAS